MRNVVVVLFPEEEYLLGENSCIPIFNECLQKRYVEKGYTLIVVNYKNSKGFIQNATKEVFANISFQESSPYFIDDYKTPDFQQIAFDLDITKSESIVLCGFHCFDCVEKLAKEIYKLNKNIVIDTDLTDLFAPKCYSKHFNIGSYDPDEKFNKMIEKGSCCITNEMFERYKHPIWGISKTMLQKLKAIKEQEKSL